MSRVMESSDKRIPSGSDLLAIDEHPIKDFLDFTFYNDIGTWRKALIAIDGQRKTIAFKPGDKIGIKIAEPAYRSCENRCQFCFVNGLPDGLRKEVYFRDDDYRLSFLFGNFLSLTNLGMEDVERISRLRLSPLYVSVHSTTPETRIKLFNNPRAGLIMKQINMLAANNIRLHCQVVVIPGITDGNSLEQTITDLASFFPSVNSVGIVPVGKTKYLRGIARLTKKGAAASVKTIEKFQHQFRRRIGTGFVYASDEFFIRAGLPIPPQSYYDEFPQYENGIGMVRQFIDEVRSIKGARKSRGNFLMLTGEIAHPFIRMLKERLAADGWRINLAAVRNSLFGDTVTVSGLLGAGDISKKAKSMAGRYDLVILPPNCVNDEDKFIDNKKPEIKNFLVAPYSIKELIKCLQ